MGTNFTPKKFEWSEFLKMEKLQLNPFTTFVSYGVFF
ncbi:MAG: hypothetical protein Ct9H90mP19_4670 [Gammaproteobacteria bacterium]|nr:MAG: hypothetical protein Ct9H90mP19_4670 [Gammaproteobacteria bacterium]